MTPLTNHFTREEFEHSDQAISHNIDNTCPEALLPNLQRVAELLEKVRAHVGTVIVTSGYRCPELNPIAGGAPNSAHLTARAADIRVAGITAGALATYIKDSGIVFDKCILEFPASPHPWVHVQVEKPGTTPRQQCFVAVHSPEGTKYIPGLVVA